jgi:TRAP transporter TAXI family solute receptor
VRLIIKGGIIGGAGYMHSLGLNQIIAEHMEGIIPLVQGTPGFVANAKRLYEGLGDIGVVLTTDVHAILAGEEPFKEPKKYLLQMYPLLPPKFVHFMVRQDSPIQSMADLSGKRINLLTRGSLAEMVGSMILEALDIKPGAVFHYPHGDAARALAAGDIDAAVAGGTAPAYAELSLRHPLRVLSLTEEEAKKINATLPHLPILEYDFGEVYKGAKTARVVAPWTVMAATHDLDEELVYRLTKAVFDNYETIVRIFRPAAGLKPEMVVDTLAVLHPGAIRFYEEIGIPIPPEMRPPADIFKR